jgi:hypothetical protein
MRNASVRFPYFLREEARVGCLEVELHSQTISAEHGNTMMSIRTHLWSFV